MGSLLGGGSSNSQSSSINLNPAAFNNLAPSTASGISGLSTFGGIPTWTSPSQATPFMPLVSPSATNLMNATTNMANPNTTTQQGQNYLSNLLTGGQLSPASNPFLNAAIQGAVNPLVQAFNTTTMPGLQAQFAQAGQSGGPGVGGAGPQGAKSGSTQYDKAAAIAQTGLDQSIAQTTSAMENQNYQNTQNLMTQAAENAPAVQSQMLNNIVTGMQANLLPTMIQQYGITTGTQMFTNQVQALLSALGLGVQAAKPVAGQESTSSSSFQPSLLGSLAQGASGAFSALTSPISSSSILGGLL